MSSENVHRSNEVISNQIYYKPINQFAPRYKYVKVYLSNVQSTTVPLSATSNTPISFKLPYNTVFNPALSKLAYLTPIPAQGAGTYTYMVVDAFPLGNQLVSFETGNGLQMLNLPEPAKYTKIVTKFQTKLKDFMSKDLMDCPRMTNSAANNPTPLNTADTVAVLEPQYFFISAVNAANNIPLYYSLGNFKNTILGLDKDLYFGQNDIYLKVTIGPVNTWCFQATSASAPNGNGNAALTTTIPNLQNFCLYLAVEQNPVIIDNIIKQYDTTGLKVQIDYPIITKVTSPVTTNHNIVIPFTPAMGHYCRRIYHTVWNVNEITGLNLVMDCENGSTSAATQKITSYNTYIDSTKLQDDVIYCATAPTATAINADDWRLMEPFARDSAILNYAVFQKNWCHIDDFSNPQLDKDNSVVSSQNVIDGLPMERAIQYTFTGNITNAAQYIHDNFAIFTREVHISKNGVQFI